MAWANSFARVFLFAATGKLLLAHATRLLTCAIAPGQVVFSRCGFLTAETVREPGTPRGLKSAARRAFSARILVAVIALTTASSVLGVERNPSTDPSTDSSYPKRIVTIAPNAAEIICELGACDRIVGVSEYCVFPSQLSKRPRVGGFVDPDLERIVALHPDLIVLRGRNEALESLCQKRGIPIYRDRTDSLPGVTTCANELGKLLGLQSEANELVAQFQRRIARISARVHGRPKPRVFVTLMRPPDRLGNLLTTGPGTFLDEMIEIAGGENIFGNLGMRYPQVSVEAVVVQRPDVIIELFPELTLTEKDRAGLRRQWGSFVSIPAVRSHRVYFIDDAHALIPSPRYVEIIDKVSRILHPERAVEP